MIDALRSAVASSMTSVQASDVSVVVEDFTVSAALTLTGLPLASWGAEQQSAFAQAVAAQLGVPASTVSVGTPYAWAAGGSSAAGSRRALLAGSASASAIAVPFTVSGIGRDYAAAQALAASVPALGAAGSSVGAALKATSAGVRVLLLVGVFMCLSILLGVQRCDGTDMMFSPAQSVAGCCQLSHRGPACSDRDALPPRGGGCRCRRRQFRRVLKRSRKRPECGRVQRDRSGALASSQTHASKFHQDP